VSGVQFPPWPLCSAATQRAGGHQAQ